MSDWKVETFGPAYLDRVLAVEEPLLPAGRGVVDLGGDGCWISRTETTIRVVDSDGFELEMDPPPAYPGPRGVVLLKGSIGGGQGVHRHVRATSWSDDLGGMGAGFAAALGGRLICVLGGDENGTSRAVRALLVRHGIDAQPVCLPGSEGDWTLLITSGGYGDKLPVGFRGCHAAAAPGLLAARAAACDLRVVAGLSNAQAAALLAAPGARLRLFAPSLRNMLDRSPSVLDLASSIDILSCNIQEWGAVADREEIAWRVSILIVTDGPRGATIRHTLPDGNPRKRHIPAAQAASPPRDTNHAGEAFAAAFVQTLLEQRWDGSSGVIEPALVDLAAEHARAAGALVIERTGFSFPTPAEIEQFRVHWQAGGAG